jgi:hypothetical protein
VAQQQRYGQELGRGQFANQAQQQTYDQNLGRRAFANQAINQNNQTGLAEQAAYNSALDQDFARRQAYANFGNNANQQNFQNDVLRTQFNNDQGQANFQNSLGLANFRNMSRDAELAQRLALRNQPINEISALLSGGQVSLPNFAAFNSANVAPTPIGQYMYNTAGIQQQQANNANQQNAATLGGLYGLGASAIKAAPALISERRFKKNIVPLGAKTGVGFDLYSYTYIWGDEPQVGVMVDEVEGVMPEAVVDMGGVKGVIPEMVGLPPPADHRTASQQAASGRPSLF